MTNPIPQSLISASIGLQELSRRLTLFPAIEMLPFSNLTEVISSHLSNPYIPGVILQSENAPRAVLFNFELFTVMQKTIDLIPSLLSEAQALIEKQQVVIKEQATKLKLGEKMVTEISELAHLTAINQYTVIAFASLGTYLIIYGVYKKTIASQQTQNKRSTDKGYRFLGWSALGVCSLIGSVLLAHKNIGRSLFLANIVQLFFKPSTN